MKKFLLMAALAAGTMTANAQMKLNPEKIQKTVENAFVGGTVANTTRAAEVVNMYYYRPMGVFYTGWNKGLFNPGETFAPANTDIHFEAVYADGKPIWEYPSGKIDGAGEPERIQAEGNTLDINLPKGRFFTPVLGNANDLQNDVFKSSGYMNVGGTSYMGEGEYNGEPVCADAFAVNYVPTGNINFLLNYFCTSNNESDKNVSDQLLGGGTYKSKGFGEVFSSKAEFSIKGFDALLVCEETIADKVSKLKPSIIKFTQNGQEVLADKNSLTLELTEVQAPNGGYGIYHFYYTLNGDPIKVAPGEIICPLIETTKVQISPAFDGQPRWDETVESTLGITTKMILAETDEGEVFASFPSLGFTDNKTGEVIYANNWCFGLDLSYDPQGFAGIDNVVADEVAGNGAVYTVEGVKVSNGDVENLPAGVYVKDGKKFVVR